MCPAPSLSALLIHFILSVFRFHFHQTSFSLALQTLLSSSTSRRPAASIAADRSDEASLTNHPFPYISNRVPTSLRLKTQYHEINCDIGCRKSGQVASVRPVETGCILRGKCCEIFVGFGWGGSHTWFLWWWVMFVFVLVNVNDVCSSSMWTAVLVWKVCCKNWLLQSSRQYNICSNGVIV